MPDFAYIARNLTGQRVEGTLVAGSEREALAQLAGRDLFPVKVTADKKSLENAAGTATIKVPVRIVVPVYSQLAALLRSGVPLLRSLQVISEQSSNEKLRAVLEDVRSRVEDGANLSDAMGHNPKTFDELSVSIVRAGGEGGFLEDALERVAAFAEQQGELQSRVVGALAYPMMLSVIGTGIVTGLMVFVVPNFEKMFATLKEQGQLPLMTTWLLWISDFMVNYGIYILVAFVALYFLIKKYLETPEGRMSLDKLRLKVPMAGDIYLSLAVARFCRVLGTLLHGGVPIVRSLEIASDSTGNKVLMEAVNHAAENISSGESLAEPLGASGHFPRNVVEMIAVAEQSNSLETVLTQIAETQEKTTWRKLDLAVRLLEPLLLVLLAIVVLMVVMALLLPVLKMNTAM
ncbi:type II secretion system F family protein [Aeoliella mucimassa]|uniref:General secretion pathway protein F n=1 Tax=Aeoliella mucimassa TaxID=2527972 RepID=A0A518AL48_9BACT|nr:type II secretion system F family protein [Aeoliella mucimassa]QDU55450.1 Type II secretion system protein F [Aeoliella mucimassa]